MKMNKRMMAVALALGIGSAAQAQQQVFITGSTAFRAQVYAALKDMGLTVQANATSANNNFNFTGVVSTNTITTLTNGSAGHSVQVFAAFTGSSEGLNSLIFQVSPIYTNLAGIATNYANGADIAFCDVQQSSTPYANDTALDEISSFDGLNSSFGAGVAVVPFLWSASADAEGKIGNVTPSIINDIFVNGTEPLNFFTGQATNSSVPVYLIGRTNDSGTRITAEQVVGFDPAQDVSQYAVGGILSSVGAGTYQSVGNNGYSSGGNVAKALSVLGAGNAIGYVAFSDAANLKNGALPINYEGTSPFVGTSWIPNSTPWNLAGIENGSYTFWSYEHLYESPKLSTTSFISDSLGPDLVNALEYEILHPAAGAVQSADVIGNLNVHRNSDGTDVLVGN
jgi:hypothetical protein